MNLFAALKMFFTTLLTGFHAINEVASALDVMAVETRLAAEAFAAEQELKRRAELKALKAELKTVV